MATYSSNTTIKMVGAISATGTRSSTGLTTVYTVPANHYALVNIGLSSTGGNTYSACLNLDTIQVVQASGTAIFGGGSFYLGPGQSVILNCSNFSSGTMTLKVSGVTFTNTP